jgi:hypothetical protein
MVSWFTETFRHSISEGLGNQVATWFHHHTYKISNVLFLVWTFQINTWLSILTCSYRNVLTRTRWIKLPCEDIPRTSKCEHFYYKNVSF